MTDDTDRIRDRLKLREQTAQDIAIYNTLVPAERAMIPEVVQSLEALSAYLLSLKGNSPAQQLHVDQFVAALGADGSPRDIGLNRVWPYPIPWPFPWPPVWLGRGSSVIEGDEVEIISTSLLERVRSRLEKPEHARAITFALVGCAIAVGTILGKAWNKFRTADGGEQDPMGAFITYIHGHGANTLLAAATSRPDYLAVIDAIMPNVEDFLSDAETLARLDQITNEVKNSSERLLVEAVVFVVIAGIAFYIETA